MAEGHLQADKAAAAFLASRRQVPIYSCYAKNCNRTFVRVKDVKNHLKTEHKRLERSLPTLKESEPESEGNDDVEIVAMSGPPAETETERAVASILSTTPEDAATSSGTDYATSSDPTTRRVPGRRDGPPRTPAARPPRFELAPIRRKLQLEAGQLLTPRKKTPTLVTKGASTPVVSTTTSSVTKVPRKATSAAAKVASADADLSTQSPRQAEASAAGPSTTPTALSASEPEQGSDGELWALLVEHPGKSVAEITTKARPHLKASRKMKYNLAMRLGAMQFARRRTVESLATAMAASGDRPAAAEAWLQKELTTMKNDDDSSVEPE
jgi:hypothetical protein